MPNINLAVTYTSMTEEPAAAQLAQEFALPLLAPIEIKDEICLIQTSTYLGLITTQANTPPFQLNFLSHQWQYRLKQASLRKERLARAIGISPSAHPKIIDATAGLGRDGFLLAALGYEITLIERSPILFALLRDGLNRASQTNHLMPICQRIHLIYGDSQAILPSLAADVIYLDPMFPDKKKSAAVKKEMALLQILLGKDQDAAQLLDLALTCAHNRVVVKRPRLGDFLSSHQPHFSLTGTSSRFDVYCITSISRG